MIYRVPGVAGCAVIGRQDPHHGEIPVAFIQPEEGVAVTPEAIKTAIRPHLAPYKLPRHIYIVDELPRNATGKVLKRKLSDHTPHDTHPTT